MTLERTYDETLETVKHAGSSRESEVFRAVPDHIKAENCRVYFLKTTVLFEHRLATHARKSFFTEVCLCIFMYYHWSPCLYTGIQPVQWIPIDINVKRHFKLFVPSLCKECGNML